MQLLKQFWQQFVASISNLGFYQQLIQKPTRFVLAYFFGATLLFGLGSAVWFQLYFLPHATKHAQNVHSELLSSIPDDAGIRTNNRQLQLVTYDATGAATIAKRELKIPSPPSLPQLLFIPKSQLSAWDKAWPAHLVIVSPTTINSPQDYLASLDTTSLVLVDPDKTFIYDGEKWEETTFNNTESSQSEITAAQAKNTLNDWGQVVSKFVSQYSYLLWPIIIVGSIITHGLALAWYSLLTFLVSRAFNYKLSYREGLKITAYIAVISQCISYITQAIYPWFGLDMFSLSYWAICLYVLYVLKTAQTKQGMSAAQS